MFSSYYQIVLKFNKILKPTNKKPIMVLLIKKKKGLLEIYFVITFKLQLLIKIKYLAINCSI